MRSRALIFFALALILAAVTVHYVRQRLSEVSQPVVVTQKVASTYVLVAANELGAGTLLDASDLRWQSWPNDQVDGSYVVQGKGTIASMVGAVVRGHIAAGEPVGTGMVIQPGERGFLAAVLAPGMDAVSAPLSPVTGAGGLVLPGDHVDLILEHQLPGTAGANAAPHVVGETILVDLRVVAIDQSISDADKKTLDGRTVTLEVTPKQAEAVEVAKQLGALSVVLRSAANGDPSLASVAGSYTMDSDVSPLLAPPRAVARSSGGIGVTIIRGDVGGGGGGGITTTTLPGGGTQMSVSLTTQPAAAKPGTGNPGGS